MQNFRLGLLSKLKNHHQHHHQQQQFRFRNYFSSFNFHCKFNQVQKSNFSYFYSRPHSRFYSTTTNSLKRTWISRILVRERKWNSDDVLALASWVLIGNGALLLLGTTTFVSLWLGIITRLPFQDEIINYVCRRVMDGTGLEFKFKKAEAKWKDGLLRLSNVQIVRNPHGEQYTGFDFEVQEVDLKLDLMLWLDGKSILTELGLRGVKGTINRRHLNFTGLDPSIWTTRRKPALNDLHLTKLQIKDCFIRVYDYNNFRPYTVIIHRADLKRFRIQWLLFDILTAENVVGEYDGALFSLSKAYFDESGIIYCDTFTSILASINSIDDSHFTTKLRIPGLNIDMMNTGSDGPFGWIRSGTVDIDLMISIPNSSLEGSDNLVAAEIVTNKVLDELKQAMMDRKRILEVKFGRLSDDHWKALFENLSHSPKSSTSENERNATDPKEEQPTQTIFSTNKNAETKESPSTTAINIPTPDKTVQFYLDLRFNHVRAEVPENYKGGISDALVRTIVAYLNSQPTAPRYRKSSTPPLSVHVSLPLSNFDGAWTVYQCELIHLISTGVSNELMKQVLNFYREYSERGRMKSATRGEYVRGDSESDGISSGPGLLLKVGWWTIQQVSKGVLSLFEANTKDARDHPMGEVIDEIVKGKDRDF